MAILLNLLAMGAPGVSSHPPNARLVVTSRSKYIRDMPETVSALQLAGLRIKGTLAWRHIFPYASDVSSAARAACPNPTCGPPLAGACVSRQSATRTSFQSSQFAKFLEIVNTRRLLCRVVELPYIVDFFIKM